MNPMASGHHRSGSIVGFEEEGEANHLWWWHDAGWPEEKEVTGERGGLRLFSRRERDPRRGERNKWFPKNETQKK